MANIFRKILNTFQKKSFISVGQSLFFNNSESSVTNKDYLDAYEVSFLVYACVTKIAQKVATTQFKLYKTNNGKVSEIQNHP